MQAIHFSLHSQLQLRHLHPHQELNPHPLKQFPLFPPNRKAICHIRSKSIHHILAAPRNPQNILFFSLSPQELHFLSLRADAPHILQKDNNITPEEKEKRKEYFEDSEALL